MRTALPTAPSSPRRLGLPLAGCLVIVAALLVFLLSGGAPLHRFGLAPAVERPNVIVIIADDMRFDSLWVMRSLGELAQRGVTFNRFFVTTPLCCPSRASLLNGQYARRHGVVANNPPLGGVASFDDRSTLATWLQAGGVRTGLVGRYLNGYQSTDVPPGWDAWFAIWQANDDYSNYFDYRVTDNGTRRYFGSKEEHYSTRVLEQEALRFLEQERERPFMLMITPRAPHGPATPDPLDRGTFKTIDLPLPPSYDEPDVADKPSLVRGLPRLDRDTREQVELFRRRQLESLLSVDRLIANLVDALQADGRLDRTWIIFTADNGLTLGEHRRDTHKSCPYEECVRVPLVVVPPRAPAAPTDDRLVANIDLAPTIAAIMGTEPDGPVDGRGFLPLLGDPSAAWRDGLVLEMLKDGEGDRFDALRTADRKYVRYPNGEEELYDEAADPYELENLAAHLDRSDEKARLAARLDALIADTTARRDGKVTSQAAPR